VESLIENGMIVVLYANGQMAGGYVYGIQAGLGT
jgi:hypothetical protein